MLVYILGLTVLNFKDRFELSTLYSFLNANCTYLENKMELDSNLGFWVGANCTYLGIKNWEPHSALEFCIDASCPYLKSKRKVSTLQLF